MRRLRDYQIEAAEAVQSAWKGGMQRPAIVLPTGAGKTDVISTLVIPNTLVLAHRSELLDQIAERVRMHHPYSVGRVQASHNQSRREVIVASIQTLRSPTRRLSLVKPRRIIIDEAHHASSPSYVEVLRAFGALDGDTELFGVTATMTRGSPPRKGELGLGDIWEEVVYRRGIDWAVAHGPAPWDPYTTVPVMDNGGQGWLVMPRGRCVVADHVDLDQAKVSAGDYQDGELGEMVAQDVAQIADAWEREASDRVTMMFVPSIAAAEAQLAEFERRGVRTEMVLGRTPDVQRRRVREQMMSGEVRVRIDVGVGTEGFDCPAISCIIQARPTRLPGFYQQMIGRGLRQHPGKSDCLVLDVVGASRFQRLCTLVELLPGVQYDNHEVDDLPCGGCGEPLAGCTCTPEEKPAPKVDRRRKLDQPIYEDIDLFADTDINWQVSAQGHRFISIPPSRDRSKPRPGQYVVLYEESDGTASVAVMGEKGGGRWVHLNTTPTQAQHMAEAEARAINGSGPGLSRTAPWRVGSPSEGQVKAGRAWRVPNPETMTSGRLSDEIARRACSEALARTGTEGAA
jgi:hypothetical protein